MLMLVALMFRFWEVRNVRDVGVFVKTLRF